jgi:hypothetical protein
MGLFARQEAPAPEGQWDLGSEAPGSEDRRVDGPQTETSFAHARCQFFPIECERPRRCARAEAARPLRRLEDRVCSTMLIGFATPPHLCCSWRGTSHGVPRAALFQM